MNRDATGHWPKEREAINMKTTQLAQIQYHGQAGTTAYCQSAIERLLLCQPSLASALLLTSSDQTAVFHAFILTTDTGIQIAIKSGFNSGYVGEGPRGLSDSLKLLDLHRLDIDEVEVPQEVTQRLNASCLTAKDMTMIKNAKKIRPYRFWDYVEPFNEYEQRQGNPWRDRPVDLPLPLIDDRLINEAIAFWDDPDGTLMKSFRKLETIVRGRLQAHGNETEDWVGAKLFGRAFNGDDAPLSWPNIPNAERIGRTSLFTGAFSAYRNRRAHHEGSTCAHKLANEFLLINQLFLLEQEADGPRPARIEDFDF